MANIDMRQFSTDYMDVETIKAFGPEWVITKIEEKLDQWGNTKAVITVQYKSLQREYTPGYKEINKLLRSYGQHNSEDWIGKKIYFVVEKSIRDPTKDVVHVDEDKTKQVNPKVTTEKVI